MGLVGNVGRIPVPGEPEHWIEVRGLDYEERRDARRAGLRQAIANLSDMKDLGETLEELQGSRTSEEPTRASVLASFDWAAVLDRGLVRWSYSNEEPPDWRRGDDRTLEFAVVSILELSGVEIPGREPPLKNSSVPSIAP